MKHPSQISPKMGQFICILESPFDWVYEVLCLLLLLGLHFDIAEPCPEMVSSLKCTVSFWKVFFVKLHGAHFKRVHSGTCHPMAFHFVILNVQQDKFMTLLSSDPLYKVDFRWCRFLFLLSLEVVKQFLSGTDLWLHLQTSFHPLLWTSSGLREFFSSPYALLTIVLEWKNAQTKSRTGLIHVKYNLKTNFNTSQSIFYPNAIARLSQQMLRCTLRCYYCKMEINFIARIKKLIYFNNFMRKIFCGLLYCCVRQCSAIGIYILFGYRIEPAAHVYHVYELF